MEAVYNRELELASEFVRFTNKNVFLTGKAGTGKTTFLHRLKLDSPKRMIVVAPTGVAAINAKGVTIHSFFQLPFGPYLPAEYSGGNARQAMAFSKDKINIIKSLDLLVIDEISMVRADLLDGVDEVLRKYKDRSKPFGGVQLLLIGDLHQLAPVVKDEEWEILKAHYQTAFFFSSQALQRTDYVSVELKHIYRQSDQEFISLLNKVRENKFDDQTLNDLNKRYVPGIEHQNKEGFIILSTHNHQAQTINSLKMAQLSSPEKTFEAEISGDFPQYAYPTDKSLLLKIGAQVMFVKNDPTRAKQFYNGKIGVVTGFEDKAVLIKCKDDAFTIKAEMIDWENIKYEIDPTTKEIKETVVGAFKQIPVKLAWCITIHKSQGLTFDNAIIDAQAAFAFGQVYVALSRCKTLEGMFLSSPISRSGIKSDLNIDNFTENIEQHPPTEQQLKESIMSYQQTLLMELFAFPNLKYRLGTILMHLFDNTNSVRGNLHEQYSKINEDAKRELIDVADKFRIQIQQLAVQQPNLELNENLQERIKKASAYFTSKIESLLLEVLSKTVIESDNKALKKTLDEALDLIYHEMKVKHACISACLNGFVVKSFLNARAVAILQVTNRLKVQQPQNEGGTGGLPDLYNKIREWRDSLAIEQNVEPYFILPQKVITEIVNLLPCSAKELKQIKGLGSKKIKSIGPDIVRIVSEFCLKNKLKEVEDTSNQREFETEMPAKEKGVSSRLQSLQLFQSGKDPKEIAAERSMAVSTIEEHLMSFITTGEVKLSDFLSEKQILRISTYFVNADPSDLTLTTAKVALEDEFSYSQLRLVKKHLEATGQIQAAQLPL